MKVVLFLAFFMGFSLSALAAKNQTHWYKVESQKEEKKNKNKESYPYDSVEISPPRKKKRSSLFWSLRPKVGLSGGLYIDRRFVDDGTPLRLFVNSILYFRHRPLNRIAVNFQILQNKNAFLGAEWQLTPRRKSARTYYGLGLAHLLVAENEFSNLVDRDNYHITGSYGREFLTSSTTAWFVEGKAYLSFENYAIQAQAGYIISF